MDIAFIMVNYEENAWVAFTAAGDFFFCCSTASDHWDKLRAGLSGSFVSRSFNTSVVLSQVD